MKIYLIGFMGCGKSSIGKKLASACRLSFVDTDVLFENEYQCTISDFFATHTEAEFRIKEQKILHQTAQLNDVVIATGGGIPCFEDNMQWLLSHGTVVYVEMPPLALHHRLMHSKKERPLLANKETLLEDIETLLAQREATYQKANICISGIQFNVNTLIETINNHISDDLPNPNHLAF